MILNILYQQSFRSTKQIPDYVAKQDALRAKGVSGNGGNLPTVLHAHCTP